MANAGAIEAGRAVVRVGLKSEIDAGARVIQNQLKAIGANIKALGAPLAAAGSSIAGGLGAALASLALPVKLAASVESLSTQFEVLTGSAATATKILTSLRKTAAVTPFTTEGLSKATSTLLAYGVTANDVIPTIMKLGDVSQGDQEKLERLAIAFGQVQAKGKLMAQEVNQMVENGFNPLQEISRTTGRSMNDLFKAMENGDVSFAMLQGAFTTATSAGGRFYQSMDKQSKTLNGVWGALVDSGQQLGVAIGSVLLPVVKDFSARATTVVQSVSRWAEQNRQLIVDIAKTAAGVAAAGAVVGSLGFAIIGLGAAIDNSRVIVQALASGWSLVSKVSTLAAAAMGALTTSTAAQTAATGAEVVATNAVTVAASAATKAVGSYAKSATASSKATAALGKTTASLAATLPPLAIGLGAVSAALLQYAAASKAASAASIGLPGLGSKSKRSRGPRKRDSVDTGQPNQSLILIGRKGPTEKQNPIGPAGYLPGPEQSIMKSIASEVTTTATIVAAETGVMATAWAGLSSVVTAAGGAVTSVLTGIASIAGLPVVAIGAIVAVVGSAAAYIANRAGLITKAWVYVSRIFNEVYSTGKQVFVGLTNAITNGRWDLAGKIAITALKLAIVSGLDLLLAYMWNWKQVAFDSIIDFGIALRDTLFEIFKQIPRLLRAALTGAESIGTIINEAIAGKLGSPDSLLGNTRAELQKELNQLTAEAAKLNKAKAETKQPQTQQAQAQQPAAPSPPSDEKGPVAAEAERAAQARIKRLREEIEVMRRGEEAAELFQLAQEGATLTELQTIAQLNASKLALKQKQEAQQREREEAERAKEQLIADGKQLTDSLRTQGEVTQAEIERIQRLQSEGAITNETAARGIAKVLGDATSGISFTTDQIARSGSDDAAKLQEQARKALFDQALKSQAQQIAAINAQNRATVQAAKSTEQIQQEKDAQERKKLEQDQLTALQTIAKNAEKPKQVVSIR